MKFLKTLFQKKDSYERYLDAEWKKYCDYRDNCSCFGCGKHIKDRYLGEVWATEELCMPCYKVGVRHDNRPKFFRSGGDRL